MFVDAAAEKFKFLLPKSQVSLCLLGISRNINILLIFFGKLKFHMKEEESLFCGLFMEFKSDCFMTNSIFTVNLLREILPFVESNLSTEI